MYIGCNWSKSLKFLLEKESVSVDYIKSGAYGTFNEQFSIMRSMRPVLLHGLGYFERAGMENIEIIDFNSANNLIKKCNSPHYAIHLAIKNSDMYPGMTDENIYERMSKQIQIFKNKLTVPLLLENIADTPKEHLITIDHYPYIMPEQISRLLTDNDVSFLLDLTHAKITAQYRGWNIHDYIRALPLNRVAEIHINGSGYDKNGFPEDTHQAMKNEDYKLLEWVLNYTNPNIVSLEYNGVESENEETVTCSLEKQLKEVQNICNSTKKEFNK
ncbi:DUF692 family protein [Clostridium estertheticum]|uniref:DUF692 family protein n=1 Tax=Clostridium estertheticum TaxID=238834 RepID=A0A5N7IJW9_9CLOT|nr:DUF692 family multinuclear iron-containing protein [Clostridium estertheticum]MBU3071985.1 DUF692 family protein [Clostridium estertheticum]MBU3162077.1 DUF692 family protein [Clostridium estertheticum]MPQ30600.1 DUF692 family protein [Clostridium estertheticum]MPQ61276.1 DUF692 family protein [Clostridium estertheticum]